MPDQIEELKQKNEKLQLLMQAAKTIMADIDIDSLLALTVMSVKQVMNSDRATLFLVDQQTKELVSKVTLDDSEIRVPAGAGIVGFVADTGKTVNIEDAYKDSRFNQQVDKDVGYKTKSILCMPIHNPQNDIIGAIQVLNKLNEQPFDHSDEELLGAFSSLLGISLENARAYDELEKERNSLDEKVKERTRELVNAKKETDRILDTVDQGLFILHQKGGGFHLGDANSKALHSILAAEKTVGQSFSDLLAQKASEKNIENTLKYLQLLFQKDKNAKTLGRLNPLRRAVFKINDNQRFLQFKFERIIENDQVDHIMGAVTDITAEVELNEKLARAEAENKRQMQLLFMILQTEPAVLNEFLQDIDADLETINQVQRQQALALPEKLEQVFRIVHTIKGNASLLEFSSLAETAHQCEDMLSDLLAKADVTSSDYLPVHLEVNKIADSNRELKKYIKKIKAFQTSLNTAGPDLTIRSLKKIIADYSEEEHKEIHFRHSEYDRSLVPPGMRKVLKDALIQLARNSIHHGIESMSARQKAGKPAAGTIELKTIKEENGCRVEFSDDGRGFDIDKIKKRALDRGLISPGYDKSVVPLIFKPGFSTDEAATMKAGRGMGMSIIKKSIEEAGGKLAIAYSPGKYCRFKISLPVS